MGKRQPSQPPALADFDHIGYIGGGGYADVFLYEQRSPSRQVAIKVLDVQAVAAGAVADYAAEANLMAKVSAHPFIVQVFTASVAPDGRPYLVMEYYPGDNFYRRARNEKMSVAEVLQVGVQLASAVETAHRAGVLHRDIKPANVLTSEFHRPGLTDFGIASLQGPNANAAEGLSIPWSPPEAFGDAPGDVRSDVYSLAATVYDLLAGRSPFEIRGGDNSPLAMMARIERNPVPPTGRADVPPMLERVLAVAMSKDPAHRPATAADFGRQLQAVESEMKFAVTRLELAGGAGAPRARRDDEDDDATRVKGIVEVRAQGPAPTTIAPAPTVTGGPATGSGPATVGASAIDATAPPARRREGLLAEPDVADTLLNAPSRVEPPSPLEAPKRMSKWWFGAAAAVVVFAAVLAIAAMRGGGDPAQDGDDDDPGSELNVDVGNTPIAVPPSPVGEITGVDNGDGSYTFTWPDAGAGHSYAVTFDGQLSAEHVDSPTYTGSVECIEVEVVASSGLISAPTRGCAT